jgi:hypothetical protein
LALLTLKNMGKSWGLVVLKAVLSKNLLLKCFRTRCYDIIIIKQ